MQRRTRISLLVWGIAWTQVFSSSDFGFSQDPSTPTRELAVVVKEAFAQSRGGYSSDEVILADELQAEFQRLCRRAIPDSSPEECNGCLLNLRKQGELRDYPTTRVRRVDLEPVRMVAEIAARSMQDKYQVSIDRLLSRPEWRAEFEKAARLVLPDCDLYRVRKAAFQLRKTRRLRPELITRIADWGRVVTTYTLAELQQHRELVPAQPGIYIFRDASGYLYIGEAANLQTRLEKHLTDSDRESLAAYLAAQSPAAISLELHTFTPGSRIEQLVVRRAYESELIRSRNPKFNIRP